MGRRRKGGTPAGPSRRLVWALLALLLILAATAEERTFGTITDEEQMLRTAVSMAEFGEIGLARGAAFTVHRPGGDAVSPYGIGQSLAEVPAAVLASGWERRFGPGSSQTLFVGLELLLVAAAALGAALLAEALGASAGGVLLALFGTALASPLWAYVATGFSEPLQAAALVFALLFAVRAGRPGEARAGTWSVAAGALSGVAVLTKGMNITLVPLVLAPLFVGRDSRGARLVRAALGFLPPFSVFLSFEFARFGRPFASYGGQGFTHPPLDGLWRLLVGVNKGLLWYFPLLVVSAAGVAVLARTARAAAVVGITGTLALLVALASAWWAWDGTVGWGPRLLVPAVPLLAAAAGIACVGRWRRPAWALLGLGVALNGLGVLQTQAGADAYVSPLPPVVLSRAEAKRYPADFVQLRPDGSGRIDRQHLASEDAALAPFRLHAFLIQSRLGADSSLEVKRRQATPPWAASRPDLSLAGGEAPPAAVVSLVNYDRQPFSWPHLFAASPRPLDERADAFAAAWDGAIADQILRALDVGRPDRALALGERLFELTPSGYAAALYAEGLRASGRRETLEAFLRSLPPEFRASPSLGVVQALAARDAGDEAAARRILGEVARVFPRPALVAALDRPLAGWPPNLHAMTGENLADRKLALPGVGADRPGR